MNEYVSKGDRLYVAGRLAQNSYETEDGQRRHRTEIHAQEVVFLDSRGNGNAERAGDEQTGRRGPALLVRQPSIDAFPKARHGAAPIDRGRPRSRSNRYRRRPT